MSTGSAARTTASCPRSGSTVATATGPASGTPVRARSSSRSQAAQGLLHPVVAARAAPPRRTGPGSGHRQRRTHQRDRPFLVGGVADCYLAGVSTRRVDKLVKQLGLDGISKSQVSELAKLLDETVEGWRSRPLDAGPRTAQGGPRPPCRVRPGNAAAPTSCAATCSRACPSPPTGW